MTASKKSSHRWIYLIFFIFACILSLAAVIFPLAVGTFSTAPREGQVATRDYRAPFAINYTSQVLTEQRRQEAEQEVTPVYSSPNARMARRQIEQLRAALAYINSVRADSFASTEQRLADISAMEDVQIKPETITSILLLTEGGWQKIQQEALEVLEEAMRSPIRSEILQETRNRVPALVSLSISENEANIVADLASGFLVVNSQLDEQATLKLRQQVREEVAAAKKSFAAGQMITSQGEVFSPLDIEALEQLGLAKTAANWKQLISAGLITLLMVVLVTLYLTRKGVIRTGNIRGTVLLISLFLIYLIGARWVILSYPLVSYAIPLSAFGMTVSVLLGAEIALVASIPLAILVPFGLPDDIQLIFFFIITSLFGVLSLGRARKVSAFLISGVFVSLTGIVVILVQNFPTSFEELNNLRIPLISSIFNGLVAASIAVLLYSMLARIIGTVTPMQLADLSRPDHPLLSMLLRETPGTYQHSLQVANMVEQAAELVGIDPLLVRVGALYHDVGKIQNPAFFIENQPPGFLNLHDDINPVDSAAMIIRHVTDGVELGRKFGLPRRILDFISEHHGYGITRYQYVKSIRAAGGDSTQIELEKFRYPGPKPQSRETALLMLADSCEARVRGEPTSIEEQLRDLVQSVISDRISTGQMDDAPLTLRDLKQLVDSFTFTLRSIYHPRLKYPGLEVEVSQSQLAMTATQQDASVEQLP